jgi:hypothetical protein
MGMKDIMAFLMPQAIEPFKSQHAFILKQLNSDGDDADSEEDGNVCKMFFFFVLPRIISPDVPLACVCACVAAGSS